MAGNDLSVPAVKCQISVVDSYLEDAVALLGTFEGYSASEAQQVPWDTLLKVSRIAVEKIRIAQERLDELAPRQSA